MDFEKVAAAMAGHWQCSHDFIDEARQSVWFERVPPVVLRMKECIGEPGAEQLQWFKVETLVGQMTDFRETPKLLGMNYTRDSHFALKATREGPPILALVERYALPASLPDDRMASILCMRSMSDLSVSSWDIPGVTPYAG